MLFFRIYIFLISHCEEYYARRGNLNFFKVKRILLHDFDKYEKTTTKFKAKTNLTPNHSTQLSP